MGKSSLVSRDNKTGRFVLGRESFVKISAVEGIKMSRSMRGEFERLDKEKALPPARRKALSAKYSSKKK
jgi:hypothetical protein